MIAASSVMGPFRANDDRVIGRVIGAVLPWGVHWSRYTVNRERLPLGGAGGRRAFVVRVEVGGTHVRHVYKHSLGWFSSLEEAAEDLHERVWGQLEMWESVDWTVLAPVPVAGHFGTADDETVFAEQACDAGLWD